MNELVLRKPAWLRARAAQGIAFARLKQLLHEQKLYTVCESARCPNLGECWDRGTATFMILGNICTRNCRFCAIDRGRPCLPDVEEPRRIARAVYTMQLRHAVITSVTRDDLEDGGSVIWAETIDAIRAANPRISIEVLIPDFKGDQTCLDRVLFAKPDILNHNIETVPRLYSTVRPQARYERSLELLERAKRADAVTKTGLMLGIGEWEEEIDAVLHDLAERRVDMLTLGQYLRPTPQHLPVHRWVTPQEFVRWKHRALQLGFKNVESGPLVRSSYRAEQFRLQPSPDVEVFLST